MTSTMYLGLLQWIRYMEIHTLAPFLEHNLMLPAAAEAQFATILASIPIIIQYSINSQYT